MADAPLFVAKQILSHVFCVYVRLDDAVGTEISPAQLTEVYPAAFSLLLRAPVLSIALRILRLVDLSAPSGRCFCGCTAEKRGSGAGGVIAGDTGASGARVGAEVGVANARRGPGRGTGEGARAGTRASAGGIRALGTPREICFEGFRQDCTSSRIFRLSSRRTASRRCRFWALNLTFTVNVRSAWWLSLSRRAFW